MDVGSYEMLIFNRWGQLVYRSDSPNRPWDGKMSNGKPALQGVYIYRLEIKGNISVDKEDFKSPQPGTLTLIC